MTFRINAQVCACGEEPEQTLTLNQALALLADEVDAGGEIIFIGARRIVVWQERLCTHPCPGKAITFASEDKDEHVRLAMIARNMYILSAGVETHANLRRLAAYQTRDEMLSLSLDVSPLINGRGWETKRAGSLAVALDAGTMWLEHLRDSPDMRPTDRRTLVHALINRDEPAPAAPAEPTPT